MRKIVVACLVFLAFFPAPPLQGRAPGGSGKEAVVFATFAEDGSQLVNIAMMVESIRAFAGKYSGAPVWLYMPVEMKAAQREAIEKLEAMGVEARFCEAPGDALWFLFARKVFASAEAEKAAVGKADILAWIDDDTIVLAQPDDFILPAGKALGYRPAMHRNIGQLFGDPLDAFWGRAFEKMGVGPETFFPMVTPADSDTIRPYFNAGCLAVRPERGLLGRWAELFPLLYRDETLAGMCREDARKRIFIHQAALAGAILKHLDRGEIIELPATVNYPIFFKEMFGAKREFDDLTGVVTLRHESFFRNPSPGWREKLRGPADKVEWIKERFDRKTD